jgi:hypothetical protein
MDRNCPGWEDLDCDGIGIPFTAYGGIETLQCPKCHLIFISFVTP